MFELLASEGIDHHTIEILKSLYRTERSSLILNKRIAKPFLIHKGVRQGACSSPTLFNLFPELLCRKMKTQGKGINIDARRIDLLFYADDLALIAATRADLQQQLQITEEWLRECKLEMNIAKTEYIVLGGKAGGGLITEHRARILPKATATYLGYERESDDAVASHLRKRITQANKALLRTRTILKRLPHLPIAKQIHIAKA